MIGVVRVIALLVAVVAMAAAAVAAQDGDMPGNLKIVNPFLCKPGSRFKLDCNYCTCIPQGGDVGACTRMACPLRPDECIPGSYFHVKGKLCPCPPNRFKWDSVCFGR